MKTYHVLHVDCKQVPGTCVQKQDTISNTILPVK